MTLDENCTTPDNPQVLYSREYGYYGSTSRPWQAFDHVLLPRLGPTSDRPKMFPFIRRREAPINSTASATTPPQSYSSVAILKQAPGFLDDSFAAWQSALLFSICILALSACTIFLAIRYAETLGWNLGRCCSKTPSNLEKQLAVQSKDCWDGPPFAPCRSAEENSSEIRRQPQAGDVQPTAFAIGNVREGKIAQRRFSCPRNASCDKVPHG